ncbi:sensor histidine kinase [Lacrimispora aerotolerans]|uniref:sensor histidine kinase n=1 Tax=Lacrimispora aerotolerans TaxID=36832 RepID=UPI00047CB081|nr:HAMP domain-containing sensor histidine kinase [Lacrimispora aerotolerans]
MGRVRKEREIPLSLFYLKYFLYLFFGVIAICIVLFLIFSSLDRFGLIYYANYAEKQANASFDKIRTADKVSEDMIPELNQYIIFTLDGRVKDGNIEAGEIDRAWEAVQGSTSDIKGNYYKVIPRDQEYCVLRYKIIPQYRSETLRRYLFPPETLFGVTVIACILSLVITTALRFGHVLRKKLNTLISAADHIQHEDLDYMPEKGNIKEINKVLSSMDNMRHALKLSLESQWSMEQSRKEQISALAHDLKTPLTLIRGNAEILYETNPTDEQLDCIGYIEESSLQIQEYVQMLMEINKSGNLVSPKLQKVDINAFLQEVQKQAKGLCMGKDIQLLWETNHTIPNITIDPNLLMRALSNVLANATEYTPSGGNITFMTEEENGYLRLSIRDTGSGFSPEALKYAATQFYMDDQSRNSKSHYGIGLYVADSVAKQHGGRLILENNKTKQGAIVTIEIPV